MRLKRRWLLLALPLLCALGSSLVATPRRVDYGRWRVVVLQCDDFGMEGWVPNAEVADALPELVAELPPRLAGYARSTLESAADIDSIAAFLARFSDLDGLPPILQANTIVAAIDTTRAAGAATPPAFGFQLRASGEGEGPYARPGLWSAVARAESLGVWRAELHGLTHLDLALLRRARDAREPLSLRARALGVHMAAGLQRSGELGHQDPQRAAAIIDASVEFFQRRFKRAPISVIAPDFRWSSVDEECWRARGIRVVQAKAEQVDPSLRAGSWRGRLRKRLEAVQRRRGGELLYLDRCAQLEPYGELDPKAAQGAESALRQIRRSWREGEAAVVAMHRLQWVNLDPAFPIAARAQFAALSALLAADGGARYLVDAEIEQLERRAWSVLPRGAHWVVRNFSGNPCRIRLPGDPTPRIVGSGTTLILRSASL